MCNASREKIFGGQIFCVSRAVLILWGKRVPVSLHSCPVLCSIIVL